MIYPHGDIESLGADIFAVRGSIRINLFMRISRNMAIVREGNELTLVNPIRLRPEIEKNEIYGKSKKSTIGPLKFF